MPVISFHCIPFITRPNFPSQRHSKERKLFNNFTFFVYQCLHELSDIVGAAVVAVPLNSPCLATSHHFVALVYSH